MLEIIQLVFFSLFLAGIAKAKHSCRQCSGRHTIRFNTFVGHDAAAAFSANSLSNCATGKELNVKGFLPGMCKYQDTSSCLEWNFDYDVYRYCGNGGLVSLKKTEECFDKTCSVSEDITFTCVKSVRCATTCFCKMCGC